MSQPKFPINLLDLNRTKLENFFLQLNEKPYRAQQVLQAIHQYGIDKISQLKSLSKALRNQLEEHAEIRLPEVVLDQVSEDGTRKWILKLFDGNCIETVFIPQKKRGTLCISSQVGCALKCDFCSTGHQGFSRNLSTGEIIGQVWLAVRLLSLSNGNHDHIVSNVVMMGMGEPLLNLDNVINALDIIMDDLGYGLSKHRVTVSTSGIVPAFQELSQRTPACLAVSLHATNDALRDQLVPINKKYPLMQLLAACRDYFPKASGRKISIQYVMLKGVNDQPKHAKELVNLLQGIPVKINLIPFNPFPYTHYISSPYEVIDNFRKTLIRSGFITTIRETRGEKIDAACGQLVGKVQARVKFIKINAPRVEINNAA